MAGFAVRERTHTTLTVHVRAGRETRHGLWRLRRQQAQAYNLGVEIGLAATADGGEVPSAFDGDEILTRRRRDGSMPKHPTRVQRPGLHAGLEAVTGWHETRSRNDENVDYWTGRVAKAENSDSADSESDLAYAQRRLAAKTRRRDRHVEQGTKRLFRSAKHAMRERLNGPALTFHEDVRFRDGCLVLPGGLTVPLADPDFAASELAAGWEHTGAVQIVDVTQRVTRRTRPEHRKYVARVQLRRDTEMAPLPEPGDDTPVIGVDPGSVIPVAVSDCRRYDMPDEEDITDEISQLWRDRSRCTYKSYRYRKLTAKIRKLEAKRTNRRTDASRHIAKHVADTDGVTVVVSEDKNAKQLTATAKGTAEHPGVNVAAKSANNRKMLGRRFGGIRRDIERACRLRGKHYIPVPSRGTSQTCHRCGGPGIRETQAVFRCTVCCYIGNADENAANMLVRTAQPHIAARRPGRSSSDGRPGGKPGQRTALPRPLRTSRKRRQPTAVNHPT